MTRTAEEWGRVAVSLPGWRWMPGLRVRSGSVRSWGTAVTVYPDGFVDCWDPEFEELFTGVHPSWLDIDPDDPATAGCLLALLGSGVRVWMDGADDLWTVEVGGVRASMHATLGRACIAAAEALGRWPGGEE